MFDKIVDINNLIQAYYLARKSKKYSKYVQKFEINREYNLWQLQQDLIQGKYIQIAITKFLAKDLYLDLHQNKTHIHKLKQGITFLGYTLYLYSRKIKAKTYYIMRQKYRLYIQQKYYGYIDQGKLDRAISSWWGLMKFKRGLC